MSTDKILPVGTGSLVIFTPNGGLGYYGIVTSMNDGEVIAYNFLQQRTYTVPLKSCLPFQKEDYVAMCTRDFWKGVIVQFPNKKQGVVRSGRMDVFGQDCELVIKADGQIYQWVPLSWFVTIGHINAT